MDGEKSHVWWDRAFTIFTLLLGAFLVGVTDYWKTFIYMNLDIGAYMLDVATIHQDFEAHIALINSGNRQGIVSELMMVFPFKMGDGSPYMSSGFTVEGVPVSLNPGDVRLVNIKGILPIQSMYANGSSVDPVIDGPAFTEKDMNKIDLSLRIRALDFKGKRYQGSWDIGKIFVWSENVAGTHISSNAFKIFDKSHASGESIWSSIPLKGR